MGLELKAELILIAVLMLLAASACGSSAASTEPLSAGTPYPVIAYPPLSHPPNVTSTPLPAVQKEAALHIVNTSGAVEQINGGQNWEADQFWATEIEGVPVVEVYVRWEEPVESSGPWKSLVCKRTRVAVTAVLIRDITRLQVLVDMDGGTVRELTPVVPGNQPGQTQPDGPSPVWAPTDNSAPVKVFEFKSGALLREGSAGEFQVQQDLCGPDAYEGAPDGPIHFLTVAYSVRGGIGERVKYPPISATTLTPTPAYDKHEAAVGILETSGLVEAINGGQTWRAYRFVRTLSNEQIVIFKIEWETPVETDGPFRIPVCRRTRMHEHPVPWGNVKALSVTVDIELKQVISLGPDQPILPEGLTWDEERARGPQFLLDESGSRLDGKSRAEEIVTVYDLETWKILYSGTRKNLSLDLRKCPPGLEGYRD